MAPGLGWRLVQVLWEKEGQVFPLEHEEGENFTTTVCGHLFYMWPPLRPLRGTRRLRAIGLKPKGAEFGQTELFQVR